MVDLLGYGFAPSVAVRLGRFGAFGGGSLGNFRVSECFGALNLVPLVPPAHTLVLTSKIQFLTLESSRFIKLVVCKTCGKRVPNACKTRAKHMQNACQTRAIRLQNVCKTRAKRVQNACKTCAKRVQNARETRAKRVPNACKTCAKRMQNAC